MIAYLTGVVLEKNLDSLVLDVQGVGYTLSVTPDVLRHARIGNELSLHTHLAVRENSMDLYGFLDTKSRSFFELLLGVSGIGPKSALSILSIATLETLTSAVASEDTSYLTKVSGIGKKTAQKIVIELKDKLGKAFSDTPNLKEEVEALEALKALGYSTAEARDALKELDPKVTGTSARVTEALKQLGS